MLWLFAAFIVVACCAVLLWAVRQGGASGGETGFETTRAFYRSQLEGIDTDRTGGRLSDEEAEAARAELAREYIKAEAEFRSANPSSPPRPVMIGVIGLVAVASLALYLATGRGDLPGQPLDGRTEVAEAQTGQIDLAAAVAQVEARLEQNPDDVRGWMALGPIYMETERYGEAANAYRRVMALSDPTADVETDLAEALIMSSDGEVTDEAVALLRSAAERDAAHVRSRFYLAGELTRLEHFDEAVGLWRELLAIATGDEPWVATAQAGLAAAEAGASAETLDQPTPDATRDIMIRGMVEGLAARIAQEGGSLDEWMQLIRSRQTLDGPEAALADLERGLDELDAGEGQALSDFARELGLDVEQ
ncbi:c-type cytochrome biogenesis protein CcmI [Pelagibacterium montanilacus]|uniref:c-type cytochrome biogenesis protein CcmI n=1 Tax=Pelagibacterium montanilacus TaxID=2185280 RepID=UPI001FEB5531|nr:c-type cytochrome biogenesis protein CcmI [Pelagibacterium montanilacus]